MRKKIFRYCFSLGVGIAVLSVLCSGYLLFSATQSHAKNNLRSSAHIMLLLLNEDVSSINLGQIARNVTDYRVSIIAQSGEVLYDNAVDVATLGDHSGRYEVMEAFKSGEGEAVRSSQTIGKVTYYYAALLDNQTVLRLSKEINSMTTIFLDLLPMLGIIILLLLCVSYYLSSRLSRHLVTPITSMGRSYYSVPIAAPYPELLPLQAIIGQQRLQIERQLEAMSKEKEHITNILEYMKEGFVIINQEKKILAINRAAVQLLHAVPDAYVNKSLLTLSRHPQFIEHVSKACKGVNQSFFLPLEQSVVQIFLNAVDSVEEEHGVMIFIVDVTKQQHAEKMKREFSANVTHELKTPLTSISGFAEMISNDMITNMEDVKYFGKKIHQESTRLLELINDILRLSQIEEAIDKVLEPLSLHTIAAQTVETLQYVAHTKGIALHYEGKDALVSGNSSMLHDLVYNLVENAIKYNRPQGKVTISLHTNQGQAVLQIADSGIGIPQKDISHIFERFYTVDTSHYKQTGGTGLGLSIVKHILEYHQAQIEVQSEEGVGSTFTVYLPLLQTS